MAIATAQTESASLAQSVHSLDIMEALRMQRHFGQVCCKTVCRADTHFACWGDDGVADAIDADAFRERELLREVHRRRRTGGPAGRPAGAGAASSQVVQYLGLRT